MGAADTASLAGRGNHLGLTPFIHLDHLDGTVGTERRTDAAADTFLLIHRGHNGRNLHEPLGQRHHRLGCRGPGLGQDLGKGLGPMRQPAHIDPIHRHLYRLELYMGLKDKPLRGKRGLKDLGHGIFLIRLDPYGKDHQIRRDFHLFL